MRRKRQILERIKLTVGGRVKNFIASIFPGDFRFWVLKRSKQEFRFLLRRKYCPLTLLVKVLACKIYKQEGE